MAKPVRYGKMKDSRIKWIGDIPKHWGTCRAKNSFMQSNEKGNVIPILLSASQKYGMCPQTDLDGVVKVSEKVNLQDFKTVHKNDFVISLRSFQGGFERSDYEGVCSPAYQVFHMVNSFDNNYLKWLFKSTMFIDEMNSLTVGIREGKNIKYDDFANSVLPVPPIDEQKAIAAYLDDQNAQIESLVADAKECIDDYKKWRAAIIFEAVTKGLNPGVKFRKCRIEWINHIPEHWDTVRFVMYNWIRARLGWKGLKSEEYVDEGYPFLSAFNIVDNHLYWTPLNFVNQDRYDESPEIKISIGDILLVKDGAGIGKCARVDELPLGESTVNSSLAVITPNDKFDYKYEFYYLLGNVFQNIIARLRNGMGVPHLTQEAMKAIFVPVPTLDEQRQIAAYLDEKCAAIDEIIAEKESLIADLESYKKSLIYETVTGKRKVVGS